MNKKKRTQPQPEQRPLSGAGPAKAPSAVLAAAVIAIAQSVVVIGFGLFLAYRSLTGAENPSMVSSAAAPRWVGVGSAVFLIICFGFLILCALNLMRGKKWGRGAIVLVELIFIASSFQIISGGAYVLGIGLMFISGLALVLLFRQSAWQWAENSYQ